MRCRRKPIEYEAEQTEDGRWCVTNLFTRDRKVITDREFRQQFEPVKETPKVDAKGRPLPTLLTHEVVDNPDGSTSVRLRSISEDLPL